MSRLLQSSRQCLSRLSTGSLFAPRRQPQLLLRPLSSSYQPRRQLLTLAIETSCDDTCVAILEKDSAGAARLLFNEKVTSDNRTFQGIHPIEALHSHAQNLAPLVRKALRALPEAETETETEVDSSSQGSHGEFLLIDGCRRQKPTFVSATRGPGMRSNLAVGLNLAKGLALGWDVPLLAVNHMQAHALTPRLVSALEHKRSSEGPRDPQFPFLSLLVSGGHTILVRSNSLTDHTILADASSIAIGDMLDKCARVIVPAEILSARGSDASMYGPLLEEFAFPGSGSGSGSSSAQSPDHDHEYNYNYTPPAARGEEIRPFESGHGWTLRPPHFGSGRAAAAEYEFAGLQGQVQKLLLERPDMDVEMRRVLAQATMKLGFEHLTSRLMFALQDHEKHAGSEMESKIRTVVLSGGVASNKFLRHVVRRVLDVRGYADIEVVAPPVSLCTDNAAMIAWTGMEMYENGWRSHLDVWTLRKWPLDPDADGGGILGAEGWYRAPITGQ
ncbi:glycoprotease family-domain-containing protein [Astrocystis sublimbata]|nr:glycoprotease family-domain-containing protein [Astrocystis sublimbata]